MFGKIVDGKLIIAGNKIEIKNGWITNPTEEQLIDNGYKEIIRTEKQSVGDTEKLVETYKDNGKDIEISYAKVKKTDEEIAEELQQKIDTELDNISKLEMLNAIVGDKEAISKIESILKNIAEIGNAK